jgi:hypothetical protein
MKVNDIDGDRWKIALEMFADGHQMQFADVAFYLDRKNGEICVGSISAWEVGNLDRQLALAELARGKNVFEYLLAHSQEFREITKGFKPKFSLLSDYGTGSVEVCRLNGDAIIWNS